MTGKTAEELAKKQREISVSEFFTKNRHLLGFDNPRKALLTTVKEAVDNSLDACEEAKILPDIKVLVKQISEDRYKVLVEDNGPGIVKQQIPRIFGKLLYGSKFHKLSQSLTGDEFILVKEDDKIKIIEIGKLIDKHLKDEGVFECNNIKVPCFDWSSYKYSFRPVSSLIKHKRRNEIYSISTRYGKKIKVTGCHSLFTVNKETLKVEEVEARNLSKGDIILSPRRLVVDDNKNEVNILDYIEEKFARKRYWYLYTDKEIIDNLFSKAEIIHKKKLVGKSKKDKSRKYYRFKKKDRFVDIVDDSFKQYMKKGFIPVWLVKFLNERISEGVVRTYYHGKAYDFPVILSLTPSLMKFFGLFIAEGHTCRRQIGFTFSRHERDLIKFVCDVGYCLGVNYTIEERPEKNSTRVKLFGGILSYLFRRWFGHGAKNKKFPDFVFTASNELRQDCLDYLYIGDGHNTKNRNQLMLTTVSKKLANQAVYLWMLQGVISSISEKIFKGFGKNLSKTYVVSVYGDCINKSHHYSSQIGTKRRNYDLNSRLILKMFGKDYTNETLNYFTKIMTLESCKNYSKDFLRDLFDKEKIGYKLRFMLDKGYLIENGNGLYSVPSNVVEVCDYIKKLNKLLMSDFIFLPVKNIEMINEGYDFVYDLSVPKCENFVGGCGGIACHNSRGQQGIGVSAAAMYGQLTTGKATKITSKIKGKKKAHYYELQLNTKTNEPEIIKEDEIDNSFEHGVRVEIELEAKYQKGKQSIDEYLKQTAISNPHVRISYVNPEGKQIEFPRATKELPKEAKEIKPHPYGVELGILMKMLRETKAKTLQSFLINDFSRVSAKVAREICEKAGLYVNSRPSRIVNKEVESLFDAIKKVKIMSPPTNCLSPIGEDLLLKGLKKEVNAEFYAAVTRPPSVYRGNPFCVEVAVGYGGSIGKDELVKVLRFANRVPLQYQPGACAITKAVVETAWRNYGLSQSKGALPVGPVILVVHIASVWVPFTSESKEAIAHYPEIIKEIKLALQECGRKLASYIRKTVKARELSERVNLFEKYIPELASSLSKLTKEDKNKIMTKLYNILKKGVPELKNGQEKK
jgi:DNA topoisomerase-6 subunit B